MFCADLPVCREVKKKKKKKDEFQLIVYVLVFGSYANTSTAKKPLKGPKQEKRCVQQFFVI